MNLRERLERVQDSYEWFVSGAIHIAEDFGVEDELARYLANSEALSSSEILKWLIDYCGLKPLPIVPDDRA